MAEPQDTTTGTPPPADEPADAPSGAPGRAGGIDVQGMLGQLQSMISKVATASEPALRQVAAKAAELAAVAAERAGPIAHTLADKTEEVGHSVAEHATSFASAMRTPSQPDAAATGDAPPVSEPAEDSPSDGA